MLSSDNKKFGGFGNIDEGIRHFTQHDELYADDHKGWLKLYLPARTCQVLRYRHNNK